MNETNKENSQAVAPASPGWYIVRTVNLHEQSISRFLSEKGLENFFPQMYVRRVVGERQVRKLVPAVHNILFVRRTIDGKAFMKLCIECPLPAYAQKKIDSNDLYVIPDPMMTEFRMICDPAFIGTEYATAREVEAKPGKPVRIIHGPLAGIEGKLVRVKNAYFIVKTMAGVGVRVRISRWYCEVLDKPSTPEDACRKK